VGSHEQLAVGVIHGIRPRWCGSAPEGVLACGVQIRAHGEEFPARAWLDGTVDRGEGDGQALRLELTKPAVGVAPGQAAVLYDGSRVVGSATITGTSAPARSDDGATAGR
jgi:tRNA-specific 2-thiouridylase